MKKLFTLTAICILCAIILSSCGSGLSITKRRYSKGYYVNKTHGHRETKETGPARVQSPTLAATPIRVAPVITNETADASDLRTETKNVSAAATPAKKAEKKTVTGKSPVAAAFTDFSVKKPLKSVDKAIKAHKLYAGDGEGLSLFWIVILIVLILWALGLISGNFGNIINVLLIIALILLILWLLRVL